MLDFTRQQTITSALRYTVHRKFGRGRPVVIRMKAGPRFELRLSDTTNNDYGVAYEIFVHGYYKYPGKVPSDDVKLVIDMGANVGYSVLYFLHQYSSCRIIAFEPHPVHAAQVLRNLELDGTRSRVDLYPKAAGASQRMMRLTDCKSSARLTEHDAANSFPVEVVDVFPVLSGRRIDILKMDMEGGEYEILGDPRFSTLDIGAVVMEWHSRGNGTQDRRWCEGRLHDLGFTISEIFAEPHYGMFWAIR